METKFTDGTEVTPYMATAYAEGFETPKTSNDIVIAWSYLIGTKLAYSLQGMFGRRAESIVKAGYIAEDGTVDWDMIIPVNEDDLVE